MIKAKFSEILGAKDSLSKLAQANVPVKVAYRISKMLRKFQDELSFIESQRTKIFNEFGVKDDGGAVKFPSQEAEVEVSARWSELMTQDVELSCDKINLVSIGDDQVVKMNAFDAEVLDKFVIFELEEMAAPAPPQIVPSGPGDAN